MTKNENAVAQSPEDNVPKAVIHDCYVLVFDSIVNRKVFLPSYKSNLLYWMKQYVPANILEEFNGIEQDYIFEQVFEKFIKAELISLDKEKLSYKVDSQGVLDLVTDKVLLSKPKTVTGLNNVIKQKLATYRQLNNEEQVNLVVMWLKNQGFIKQNGQNICYLTLGGIKVNTNKISSEINEKSKSSATTYQRAIRLIKDRPINSRPSKKSTLINYLKNHLRNDDSKEVENLVNQMVTNKMIVISDSNKLSYKI